MHYFGCSMHCYSGIMFHFIFHVVFFNHFAVFLDYNNRILYWNFRSLNCFFHVTCLNFLMS